MANIKGLKSLKIDLDRLPKNIDAIVSSVLSEYIRKIYNEAMSNLSDGSGMVRSSFNVEISNNGYRVSVFSDNELAAYLEFGTGRYAEQYLSGKPQEMRDEAIKFYVNGEGTLPARPYLFPAFYKYRDEILRVLESRLQKQLANVSQPPAGEPCGDDRHGGRPLRAVGEHEQPDRPGGALSSR